MERLKQRLLHKVRIPKGNTFSGKTREKTFLTEKTGGKSCLADLGSKWKKNNENSSQKMPTNRALI